MLLIRGTDLVCSVLILSPLLLRVPYFRIRPCPSVELDEAVVVFVPLSALRRESKSFSLQWPGMNLGDCVVLDWGYCFYFVSEVSRPGEKKGAGRVLIV